MKFIPTGLRITIPNLCHYIHLDTPYASKTQKLSLSLVLLFRRVLNGYHSGNRGCVGSRFKVSVACMDWGAIGSDPIGDIVCSISARAEILVIPAREIFVFAAFKALEAAVAPLLRWSRAKIWLCRWDCRRLPEWPCFLRNYFACVIALVWFLLFALHSKLGKTCGCQLLFFIFYIRSLLFINFKIL